MAKSYVDQWVEIEKKDKHKRKALENASRHFDENDILTVNTLEAIYGQESSFGTNFSENKRGSSGVAGHFQIAKKTAKRYGLIVTKDNDQRFDIDYASDTAARYLKDLYEIFGKRTVLSPTRKTTGIKDINERKKFVLAAYNTGEGRISQAQIEAEKSGETVTVWDNIKEFLGVAGSNPDKEKEIKDYVIEVQAYEEEFILKSVADKEVKKKKPKKVGGGGGEGCHFVTLKQGPVCIDD